MATKTTTESIRNDTETARTPGMWANQIRAFMREDATVSDTEATIIATAEPARTDEIEGHVAEMNPTATNLFNHYTKRDREMH